MSDMSLSLFNFGAFESLMNACKESSKKIGSPILTRGKAKAAGISASLEGVKSNLSFKFLESGEDGVPPFLGQDLTIDQAKESKKNPSVVINWLVNLTKQLITHVNNLGEIVKINQRSMEEKAEKSLVDELKAKVKSLELDNDDIRQRSMTGNIIIASPQREGNPTLALRQQVRDRKSNTMRQESMMEMCIRLVKEKTSVEFPLEDVVACHPIGKGKGTDTTFVMRVINRNPDSSWDLLSHALKTGKNRSTGQLVNNQLNCFVSYQLTPRRGELMKACKNAKLRTKSLRYGADQQGRITVRVNERCMFEEVKSEADLARIISNPTLNLNFRNHRG